MHSWLQPQRLWKQLRMIVSSDLEEILNLEITSTIETTHKHSNQGSILQRFRMFSAHPAMESYLPLPDMATSAKVVSARPEVVQRHSARSSLMRPNVNTCRTGLERL